MSSEVLLYVAVRETYVPSTFMASENSSPLGGGVTCLLAPLPFPWGDVCTFVGELTAAGMAAARPSVRVGRKVDFMIIPC